MKDRNRHGNKMTVFYCVNCLKDSSCIPINGSDAKFVKVPCSGMVKEIFILRAFEAGADSVMVIGCPEGKCRHIKGNINAGKSVKKVRRILDEIGIDKEQLYFLSLLSEQQENAGRLIKT